MNTVFPELGIGGITFLGDERSLDQERAAFVAVGVFYDLGGRPERALLLDCVADLGKCFAFKHVVDIFNRKDRRVQGGLLDDCVELAFLQQAYAFLADADAGDEVTPGSDLHSPRR